MPQNPSSSPSPWSAAGFQAQFLDQPMGPVGIVLFGVFFTVLSIAAVQLLVGVWPDQRGPVGILWIDIADTPPESADTRLLLIAVFAGALGSFVHAATSFIVYLGNRQLKRSWAAWYVLRPFIGMALGVLFYFLIRAGFMAPGADGTAINPYGIAAVAGLAGMFSKEATDKLQQVFEDLLKPPEHHKELRGDKLKSGG